MKNPRGGLAVFGFAEDCAAGGVAMHDRPWFRFQEACPDLFERQIVSSDYYTTRKQLL